MMEIPVAGLAEFITDLAAKHNIRYVETATDKLAEVINRLSDEVEQDDIVDLLLALSRSNVITKEEWMDLLVNHLREKFKDRP